MNGPEQAKQKDVIEKQLDLDWSRRLCLNVTLTWTSERERKKCNNDDISMKTTKTKVIRIHSREKSSKEEQGRWREEIVLIGCLLVQDDDAEGILELIWQDYK